MSDQQHEFSMCRLTTSCRTGPESSMLCLAMQALHLVTAEQSPLPGLVISLASFALFLLVRHGLSKHLLSILSSPSPPMIRSRVSTSAYLAITGRDGAHWMLTIVDTSEGLLKVHTYRPNRDTLLSGVFMQSCSTALAPFARSEYRSTANRLHARRKIQATRDTHNPC